MARDVHSHARPDEARVTHLSLSLAVDFARKVLTGSATLDLWVSENASAVVLDARHLDIHA